MKRRLCHTNIDPEEKLGRARERLAKDKTDVDAMLAIAENPSAGEEEKNAVLKSFLENAREIVARDGLFEKDTSFYKRCDEEDITILFLYCAGEQEKRGAYEEAFHIYETALKLMQEKDLLWCKDYRMRLSCMDLCVRCGDLERSETLCEEFPDDSVLLILTSFLFFRENRLDKAEEYLNKCRDTNMFTEEFVRLMLEENCAEELKSIRCCPVKAMREFIILMQKYTFLFERGDFFRWADDLVLEETKHRKDNGQYKKNFFVYETDFLMTGDVTGYYKWNEEPGMMIKDGKLYTESAGELVCKGPVDKNNIPFYAIEGISDDTYIAWTRWHGNRAGYALVCFRGQWRIAIRTESDLYMNGRLCACPYAKYCMPFHMKDMAQEKRFQDYIFIFSAAYRKKSWPPKKSRAWILLPERLYKDWAFLSKSGDIEYRLAGYRCPKDPSRCRIGKQIAEV